jgi:hypothetical protein
MVQTLEEFKDDLKMLREEIFMKGDMADTKMLASWIDRLVTALENVCPTVELMNAEIEQLAQAEEMQVPSVAMRPPKAKKAAKKKSKPAKKSKKRR